MSPEDVHKSLLLPDLDRPVLLAVQTMLQVICLERGTVMEFTENRIRSAEEKLYRLYPNGAHIRIERKYGNLMLSMQDAMHCPGCSEHPARPT